MNHFLTGFGLGLIGGMLFAPKSGSETRHTLADGAYDGMRYMKDRSVDLKHRASELVGRKKEEMNMDTMHSSSPVPFHDSGVGQPAFLG